MGSIFLEHACNIARHKSYPRDRGMFLDWEVIFRSWRAHKVHLIIISLLSSDNYGKKAWQKIFLDRVADMVFRKKPYRFLMSIWKVQSKQQQGFLRCAESNMQKSEQEVSKDSSWFPFSVRDQSCRSAPFCWTPVNLVHWVIISAFPLPPQWDFCTSGRAGITLMVTPWAWLQARSIANRVFCHPVCCWYISHELSNSQWGSVHLGIHQPRCAVALCQPAWAGCAATSSDGFLGVLQCSILS